MLIGGNEVVGIYLGDNMIADGEMLPTVPNGLTRQGDPIVDVVGSSFQNGSILTKVGKLTHGWYELELKGCGGGGGGGCGFTDSGFTDNSISYGASGAAGGAGGKLSYKFLVYNKFEYVIKIGTPGAGGGYSKATGANGIMTDVVHGTGGDGGKGYLYPSPVPDGGTPIVPTGVHGSRIGQGVFGGANGGNIIKSDIDTAGGGGASGVGGGDGGTAYGTGAGGAGGSNGPGADGSEYGCNGVAGVGNCGGGGGAGSSQYVSGSISMPYYNGAGGGGGGSTIFQFTPDYGKSYQDCRILIAGGGGGGAGGLNTAFSSNADMSFMIGKGGTDNMNLHNSVGEGADGGAGGVGIIDGTPANGLTGDAGSAKLWKLG